MCAAACALLRVRPYRTATAAAVDVDVKREEEAPNLGRFLVISDGVMGLDGSASARRSPGLELTGVRPPALPASLRVHVSV